MGLKIGLITLFFWVTWNGSSQVIEKYSIEMNMGIVNYINNKTSQNHVDYLNYISEYDSSFFDTETLNFSSHFWLKNKYQINFEIGMESDLVPRHLDICVTKQFSNLGINAGFANEIFFLYEIENYYKNLETPFFCSPDYVQFNFVLTGPYMGMHYEFYKNRLTIMGDVNAGIHLNNKPKQSMLLKELNSNYVWGEINELKMTPSVWIAPSVNLKQAFVKKEKFDFGVLFAYEYFYTPRKLKYKQTTYTWTLSNKTSTEPDMKTHHIQRHTVNIGIYVLLKK